MIQSYARCAYAHRIEPEAGEKGAPKLKPRNIRRSSRQGQDYPRVRKPQECVRCVKGIRARTVYEQVHQESEQDKNTLIKEELL